MKKELLEATKIGEFLQVGVEYQKTKEGPEIGLYLASKDISASCAFLPEEWLLFVEAVNEAQRMLAKYLEAQRKES